MDAAIGQEPPVRPSALLNWLLGLLTIGGSAVAIAMYIGSINTHVATHDEQLTWFKATVVELKAHQDEADRHNREVERRLDELIGMMRSRP